MAMQFQYVIDHKHMKNKNLYNPNSKRMSSGFHYYINGGYYEDMQRDRCKTPPFAQFLCQAQHFARSEALALSSKYPMYSCLPRRSGRSYGVVKIFAFLELEQN